MTQQEAIEHLARVKFQLYAIHGIGEFNNWLDMRQNRIERQEVLDSLAFPSVRKLAMQRLARLRCQVAELDGLLVESQTPKATT